MAICSAVLHMYLPKNDHNTIDAVLDKFKADNDLLQVMNLLSPIGTPLGTEPDTLGPRALTDITI